jgi:hypothetical protein
VERNSIPSYEEAPVGELLPGLVGVVHGPVHPVAEPELIGEADRKPLDLEEVAVLAHPVDDLGAIIPVQKMLDVLPHLEALTEIFLLRHAHLSCTRSSCLVLEIECSASPPPRRRRVWPASRSLRT